MAPYYDDDGDDLQILGYVGHYDDVGAISDDIGALPRPMIRARMSPQATRARLPVQRAVMPRAVMTAPSRAPAIFESPHGAQRFVSPVPGVPAAGPRFQPLPLLTSAFTSTSGTTLPFQVTPQRLFKGRRLTYTETRTGATATGLTSLTVFAVGQTLQFAAAGAISLGSFAPGAYDTDLALDPCAPGVNITGNVNITAAPAMTDRVDFSLGLWGETIG